MKGLPDAMEHSCARRSCAWQTFFATDCAFRKRGGSGDALQEQTETPPHRGTRQRTDANPVERPTQAEIMRSLPPAEGRRFGVLRRWETSNRVARSVAHDAKDHPKQDGFFFALSPKIAIFVSTYRLHGKCSLFSSDERRELILDISCFIKY